MRQHTFDKTREFHDLNVAPITRSVWPHDVIVCVRSLQIGPEECTMMWVPTDYDEQEGGRPHK